MGPSQKSTKNPSGTWDSYLGRGMVAGTLSTALVLQLVSALGRAFEKLMESGHLSNLHVKHACVSSIKKPMNPTNCSPLPNLVHITGQKVHGQQLLTTVSYATSCFEYTKPTRILVLFLSPLNQYSRLSTSYVLLPGSSWLC